MKPEIKNITPKLAAQWLEANRNNRKLSDAHVAALSREMRSGRWKLNGDMIRRDLDGNLLDGQHRLAAVLRSGVTIRSWVMCGVPADVFDTIDVGKRRSAADTLSCLGEKDARTIAASLTLIERYMTGKAQTGVEYSNTEMEVLLRKYPDVRQHLVSNRVRTPLLKPSIMNCCHYLFWQKDPVMADEFIEKISKGVGLEMGDPWYVLRERLMNDHMSKAKLPKAHIWALCIKAWNLAREGKRCGQLKLGMTDGKITTFPVVL